MLKITTPIVAQYRAMIQRRLIDAAEEIMRSGEPKKLAAGAVTAAAGIAHNSIHHYVGSVDDLRGLVLARRLPTQINTVATELEVVEAPAERIAARARMNLQQVARTGHGWLMRLNCSITPSPATAKVMDNFHVAMRDSIAQVQAALVQDPVQLRIAAGLTRGLLEAGFRQLDPSIPVDVVVDLGEKAARGLVAGITGGSS